MNVRSLLTYTAITVGTLVAFVLAGEWALRRHAESLSGTTQALRFIEGDERKGWRSTPDYSVTYRRKTADGVDHTVSYKSVEGGFRMRGDTSTTRPRLLIIGDSFTQAVNVETGKTYAALLADSLGMEVFSYGAGGFGTLQELMVLQDVVKAIDPDVVLLQFCSNDLINNSFEMESRSTINNNRLRRPYLAPDGSIFYRNPFSERALVRRLSGFRLFNVVANLYLFSTRTSVESVVAGQPDDADFAKSVATTRTLVQRFRETIGPAVPLFVFTADDASTRMRKFPDVEGVARFSGITERKLAEMVPSLGAQYVPGVGTAVEEAEGRGRTVKDMDGAHWSDEGHVIVASVLTAHLRPRLARTGADSAAAGRITPR
jgi:lysophospholipase L1-like esterase